MQEINCNRMQRIQYQVEVRDEEENVLRKKFQGREEAIQFARANKYSQIRAIYS